jgi:hypothetical protein
MKLSFARAKRFTDCKDIGRFVECADFMEVERDKARVIVRLDDLASS